MSEKNDATVNTTSYSVRAIAGLVILVLFGGLPTLVDGRPMWAAIVGLVGVVVGALMLAFALNGAFRERRRRK